jgi:ribosomal-protein-serine acetyltransferase
LPFVDQTLKEEDTEIFIRSIIHSTCARKDLVYEIWFKKQFAGLIALKEIDRWNKKTELGYWLVQKLQGKGLVTRSCHALINSAFFELNMNRIQIRIGVGNSRSSMIAERLKFRFEGIERAGEMHQDRFIDLEVYSLLKEDKTTPY